MTRYTVHEAFYTFQGEGVHLGRAAFFIRLYGCDQRCSWCDAAGTWHPKFIPTGLFRGTEGTVADMVVAPEGAIVVITGGEPCMYDLDPLVDALHARGRAVHIETAGHRPIPEHADWITLSPKPFAKRPLPESVAGADEFKIIVDGPDAIDDGLGCLNARQPGAPIWLHPEWGLRDDPGTIERIVAAVKRDPELRAGWQVHKNYLADLQDEDSRKEVVPLGGIGGDPY